MMVSVPTTFPKNNAKECNFYKMANISGGTSCSGGNYLILASFFSQARKTMMTEGETFGKELEAIWDRKLEEATFEEKLDVVSVLGVKIYPTEDLRSMIVLCRLGLEQLQLHDRSRKAGIDNI